METHKPIPPFTAIRFAREISPEWSVDDWFSWPPDLFALTSAILTTTGIYRHAVAKGPRDTSSPSYPHLDWNGTEGDQVVNGWYAWIRGEADELPPALAQWRARVFADDASLECAGGEPGEGGEAPSLELCHSILGLHAAADQACRAFGMLANRPEPSLLKFLANFYLAVTGTLSRIPKRHGIVLPKCRTPQTGLTLRSFSHNLTFHRSEVVIQWRAIPWVNRDDNENTINLLAIPLPLCVEAGDFRPQDNPNHESGARNFQYFSYGPEKPLPEELIRQLLKRAAREVGHLHAIVFPELALDWSELERVKALVLEAAAESPADHQLPLIITGIRRTRSGDDANQIVLSTFLLNRWYDLIQDKHHRWKLTASQIRQYGLSGALSVRNQWWEAAPIPERRLTFLVPNGWLSLCPLICEDLAQLEPVSDIIRGVGPTLVLATLMDGPQLPHRWASRYVGVLADDPGSSIFTVTSLGMARRYRTREQSDENTTAAMWKDYESGHREIRFNGAQGALLSLNADWREEFTADCRSDGRSAAMFVFQSVTMLSAPDEGGDDRVRADAGYRRDGDSTEVANEGDIVEVTALCNLAEAALDAAPADLDRLKVWALVEGDDGSAAAYAPAAGDVYARIAAEWTRRGTSKKGGAEYEGSVRELIKFLRRQNARERYTPPPPEPDRAWFDRSLRLWGNTQRDATNTFAGVPAGARWRERYLAYYAVLWAVHNRVVRLKLMLGRSKVPDRGATYATATALLRNIEEALDDIERQVVAFANADRGKALHRRKPVRAAAK